MTITIRKIRHRGADRIAVIFPFSFDVKEKLKSLGHSSIKTTMVYTHVSNKAMSRIESPLDRLNIHTEMKEGEKNSKKV